MDTKLLRKRPVADTRMDIGSMIGACRSLAAAASHAQSITQVLNLAALVANEALHVDKVRILLTDKQSAALRLEACFENCLATTPAPPTGQAVESILEMVAESGRAAIFENTAADPYYKQFTQGRTVNRDRHLFFAAFPIRGKLDVLGVLVCTDTRPRKLGAIDGDFIGAITDQLAVALDNFHLRELLEKSQREILQQASEIERQGQALAEISAFFPAKRAPV